MKGFEHEATALVDLLQPGDERALGAAITVALCGHWDHGCDCRWRHFTATDRNDNGVAVRTSFDAPVPEVDEVLGRIGAALGSGELEGPDGRITRWSLVDGPNLQHRDSPS
jgi:hypothetical protein